MKTKMHGVKNGVVWEDDNSSNEIQKKIKQCNHNLLKIYYRKKLKNDPKQRWLHLTNKYYCDKCSKIIEVK